MEDFLDAAFLKFLQGLCSGLSLLGAGQGRREIAFGFPRERTGAHLDKVMNKGKSFDIATRNSHFFSSATLAYIG